MEVACQTFGLMIIKPSSEVLVLDGTVAAPAELCISKEQTIRCTTAAVVYYTGFRDLNEIIKQLSEELDALFVLVMDLVAFNDDTELDYLADMCIVSKDKKIRPAVMVYTGSNLKQLMYYTSLGGMHD